ncbi:ABC transporter permease [Paenibacillus rhizovicinus]|uniref:ABC transporter permease n=1 Tax=Paenibacillus rhizovicinus TaxID=2704463 RepID=A0A6C0P7G4_9BACL|nr:ABC transporter permease [Paenibacillus rhizovicinus]QHW34494.1 ABC transporter permease [Paenibacillus rhizovicinus]
MSVLIMLLRKMARNYWLVICLFSGMLLCIALTASMPIYKNAVLHHMLVQDLERSYEQTGDHPGMIAAQFTMQTDNAKVQSKIMDRFDAYWSSHITGSKLLHVTQDQKQVETVRFGLTPTDPSRVDPKVKRNAKLSMRSSLEEHIRLIDGKLPSQTRVDGVYEVMVTDSALGQLGMLLGQEYDIKDPKIKDTSIRIKPVAVIVEKDLNDPFWGMQNLKNDQNTLFLPDKLFEQDFIAKRPIIIGRVGGTAITDYTQFNLDTAAYMLNLKTNLAPDMLGSYNYSVSSTVWVPGSEAMTAYSEREKTLRTLLWSLNVPLFILIAFYFYMVTSMLVERQKAEISVLRSRGASRFHLVLMYAAEFGLLAIAAYAIGPWLGIWFTRVLGSTSTFLNFVNRGSLQVEMTAESWKYAAGAVFAAWVLNLVPVFIATKVSIVDQKRAKAREGKRPIWQLFGVDIILILVALYGHYMFRQRMTDLVKLGLDGKSLSADPLLYTIPTLFILGSGLLMMRLYPLFIALIYRMGRKRWAPQYYTTLLLVIRRNRIYHGLMLFLVLTVGTGIYNANTARTLNENMEDQIWYAAGSDVVLRQHWESDAPSGPAGPPSANEPVQQAPAPDVIHYLEPPFELIQTLPGVDTAAKVFTKDEAQAWLGTKSGKVKLMGIDTDDFGNAAWMKDSLMQYPFNDYLNLIAADTHAVLLSKTAADFFGAKAGDVLDVGWEGIRPTRLVVYGVVPYFPAFNPNPVAAAEGGGKKQDPMLIVGHLDTIQNELAMEPYDVWLKLKPGADRQAMLDEMDKRHVQLEGFSDTIGKISESRMDPFRMAINGVMTLGFIISLAISFLGFMLFWLLSLQGRMLQFGIYRAMGISFKQLLGMMTLEQLLTTGAGFFIGIATGIAAGQIYVPLFQLSFDPGRIVPPFEVISDHADIIRLGISTCFMLAAALVILTWLLKRMNIHQAVKLGED